MAPSAVLRFRVCPARASIVRATTPRLTALSPGPDNMPRCGAGTGVRAQRSHQRESPVEFYRNNSLSRSRGCAVVYGSGGDCCSMADDNVLSSHAGRVEGIGDWSRFGMEYTEGGGNCAERADNSWCPERGPSLSNSICGRAKSHSPSRSLGSSAESTWPTRDSWQGGH